MGAQWGSSRRLTTVASAANATERRYRRHVTTLPCPMTSGLAEEVATRVEEPDEPELLERRRGEPREGGRDGELPAARLARRPGRRGPGAPRRPRGERHPRRPGGPPRHAARPD